MTGPTTTVDQLSVRVSLRHNPYQYLLTDPELVNLVTELGSRRAASILANHTATDAEAPRGTYGRACLAMVILNPTAGPWVPATDAVMATIVIGQGGEDFLPNAAAKAAGHRRLGYNYGEAVITNPHLIGDGGFRHGHSANIRGVIVGASALNPDQDLFESSILAGDFAAAIGKLHQSWSHRTGPGDWASADNQPANEFQRMAGRAD